MSTILIACGISYQNRGHETYIPLDCFVDKDYFLSNCDDRIAIALVGRGPVKQAHLPLICVCHTPSDKPHRAAMMNNTYSLLGSGSQVINVTLKSNYNKGLCNGLSSYVLYVESNAKSKYIESIIQLGDI